jgi:ATP adenylyltransferase/5',5'''-P-1,P-4-tetraphosphate phosphorylase II
MFPVVDEYRMTELHQKYRGQEELMDPSDFTVYHAIMVAGFAVRSLILF